MRIGGAFPDHLGFHDPGHAAHNVLRVAADVVDAEDVTIGADVYEVEVVNTDSTDNTKTGDFNNTTDALTVLGAVVTYPNIAFVVGLFITIDTEILEVTAVTVNDVVFDRGVFGTTTAVHADDVSIFTTVVTDTASSDLTAKGDFNNITTPLTVLGAVVTYPNVDFTVELFIQIDSEVMEITGVAGNDVTLSRGAKSTTIVAHADAADILETSLGDVDTTDNTAGGDFNNVTDALTVTDAVLTYTAITFAVGQYLKIQTEIMEVTVIAGNDVTFARGALATTTATHADALDIFETTLSFVDSTDNTAPGRFNTVDDALVILGAVVTYPSITFSVGVFIKVESEILEVTVVASNDVTFARAAKGTSTVVHADDTAIFVTTFVDTDSTDNTAKGRFNNVEDALVVLGAVVDYPGITFVVGKLIRIETEILVATVVAGNDVTFKRAVSNTSVAAHADALDIFEGNGVTGTVAVGLVADLTPAVFTDALINDINNRGTERVVAVDISANEVLVIVSSIVGGNPTANSNSIAVSETLGGVNNAWDKANIDGGTAPHGPDVIIVKRVPTAQEVALGNLHIVSSLPIVTVSAIEVTVTSGSVKKAWDGGYDISGTYSLTINNDGAVDGAITDTIVVTIVVNTLP